MRYQLVAGSGVGQGSHENTAVGIYANGRVVSNRGKAAVQVVADGLFDLTTVLGRVYVMGEECPTSDVGCRTQKQNDESSISSVYPSMTPSLAIPTLRYSGLWGREFLSPFTAGKTVWTRGIHNPLPRSEARWGGMGRGNHRTQDMVDNHTSMSDAFSSTSNLQHSTINLSGIRVMTEDGTVIRTDEAGLFSLSGLKPGRHVFRLDERSLPPGVKLATPKAVLVDARPGMPLTVEFGLRVSEDVGESGLNRTGIRVERKADVEPRLHVAHWPPELTLGADGFNPPVEFYLFTNYSAFIDNWELTISDAETGAKVRTFEGPRESLNQPVAWDVKDKDGNFISMNKRYVYELTVHGGMFKKDKTPARDLVWTAGVIPAKAGIQEVMDPDFRQDDNRRKDENIEGGIQKSDWLIEESRKTDINKSSVIIRGEGLRVSGVREGQVIEITQGDRLVTRHVVSGMPESSNTPLNFTDDHMGIKSSEDVVLMLPDGDYRIDVKSMETSGDPSPQERTPDDEGSMSDVECLMSDVGCRTQKQNDESSISSVYPSMTPSLALPTLRYSGLWGREFLSPFTAGKTVWTRGIHNPLPRSEARWGGTGRGNHRSQDMFNHHSSSSDVGFISNLQPSTFNNIIYQEDLTLGEDDLFFVGLGDVKSGYTFHTGRIEAVDPDDKFKEGFWSEGRAAYYLKGKIKGKYLLTSSLDTGRDADDWARNLNPEDDYPVYGDASSVDSSDARTSGMLYVLLEWDGSKARWGEFQTDLGDTRYAVFNRTLYGAQLDWQSPESTEFGDPRQELRVFQARAEEQSARNEFAGTGGSLFYLKHREVIAGSQQVRLESRDRITGLTVSSETMREGIDYEIDFNAGRLQFMMPVPMETDSSSLITRGLSAGNPVFVVVDYRYTAVDTYDEGARGARAVQALGEHVRVGATRVEETRAGLDYRLEGVDVTLKSDARSVVSAEYARSESLSSGRFVSFDGGLTFTGVSGDADAQGEAWGLRGETMALENLRLAGYVERVESGFATDGSGQQPGREAGGVSAVWEASAQTRWSLRHDVQRLIEDGSAESRLQVGAQEASSTSLRGDHQLFERLILTGEWRHQDVRQRIAEVESETGLRGDTVAVGAEYQADEKTVMTASQQVSVTGERNDRTAVGVRRQVSERVTVSAEQSVGSAGAASQVGISTRVTDDLRLRGDYGIETPSDGSRRHVAGLGAEAQVDADTQVQTTVGLVTGADGRESHLTLGGSQAVNEDLSMETRETVIAGSTQNTRERSYELVKSGGERRARGSLTERDSVDSSGEARTNIAGIEGDLNRNWSGALSYEKGQVQDLSLAKYDRQAISAGVGYAGFDPVDGKMVFQSRTKGEFRLDEGTQDIRQTHVTQNLEYRMNPNVTLSAKADVSQSENVTFGTTVESYQKWSTGFAYRPVNLAQLNLLGRYTYLENQKPAGQVSSAGIEQEKAHVLAVEGVYDLNTRWQLTEKLAWRGGQEQVSGFDWSESDTWLLAQGLRFRWDQDWSLYTEYRMLRQRQAKDYKQGVHLELSRDFGEMVNVGVGYDLTDFTDDLTKLDYRAHGPFVRVTVVVMDRNEAELREIQARREAGETLREIRGAAREAYWAVYEQAVWLYDDAGEFYHDELLAMAKDRYEAVAGLKKDYESARAYVREVETKIKQEANRFLKEERVRRRKQAGPLYRVGVRHYRAGEFQEARRVFEEIGRIAGDYKKTRVYLEKIDEMGEQAP